MATDFFAGCVGGAAGVLSGHPLDTVKVRIQTQCARTPTYRGTLHCLQVIISKEGTRGLYRGLSSPLCGVTAVNALTFGIQGNVCRLMSRPDSLQAQFGAGMVAGGCQSVIVSPMELIKSHMQVQTTTGVGAGGKNGRYTSSWHCCRQLLVQHGLRRGLMRGFWVTAAREVPAFGVYFGVYEALTSGIYGSRSRKSLLNMLLAGGASGVASWVLTYPIDLVKTRLQTDGALDGRRRYAGVWECTRCTVMNEGWRGLWRGLGPACLRAFPTNAVTLAAVSLVMRLLDERREGQQSLEEFPPAELFISKLQPAYPLPRVSITAVKLPGDTTAVPPLRQLLDALQLPAVAAAPVSHQSSDVVEEQVGDDNVSEWVQWSELPWRLSDGEVPEARRRRRRRRCTTLVTQIVQVEEMVEHHEDDDLDHVLLAACTTCPNCLSSFSSKSYTTAVPAI